MQSGPLHGRRGTRFFAACLVLASAAFCAPSATQPAPAPSVPAASAPAAPAQAPGSSTYPHVDSALVHKLYLDGDFDQAIPILENNLKETRQYRHEDSVFIFKHLGVMYAAQYETREKGKFYMHRLLLVEPAANILDMYASDMIYMIFKNIKDEFDQNRIKLTGTTSHAGGPNTEADPKGSPEHGSGTKWIWAGAGVAAVAAGVGAYFLIADEPKTTVRAHVVP